MTERLHDSPAAAPEFLAEPGDFGDEDERVDRVRELDALKVMSRSFTLLALRRERVMRKLYERAYEAAEQAARELLEARAKYEAAIADVGIASSLYATARDARQRT